MSILWFLIIGLIAGWLAGQIMKGKSLGLLWNLVIGCIGAVLGGYLFGLLGFATYGLIASLIAAVVGAVVLLWVISLFKK